MDKIVETVKGLPKSKVKTDDDFFDRLSSLYTVVILVIFAILVSLSTYVGKAITCWAPKHFTENHEKYANSYCWVRNTYYLHMDERIPRPGEIRDHIPYYQWVPFILIVQAIFFYLPSTFWHGLNQKGGVDCDNILQASHTLTMTTELQKKEKALTSITNQMHRFLIARHKKYQGFHCDMHSIARLALRPCSSRYGNYLVILFLLSKLLYLANVLAQLFIMNSILSTNYHLYGFQVLNYLATGEDWTDSPDVAFPRVTFCDFFIRRLGNVQRYTLQCTLPINMYNEKIYMFLWFWMVFIAVVTVLGFIVWFVRAIVPSDRTKFIYNHLKMGRIELDKGLEQDVQPFVESYLGQDGVFVLRLIAHNTNSINVTEITCSLWKKFMQVKATVLQEENKPEYNNMPTYETQPLTMTEKPKSF